LSAQSLLTPIPSPPADGGSTPSPLSAPPIEPFSADGGNFNPDQGLFGFAGLPGGGTNFVLPGGVPGPLPPVTTPSDGGNINPDQGMFAALNNAIDTLPPAGNLNPDQGIS
jgi:hypothetical protein